MIQSIIQLDDIIDEIEKLSFQVAIANTPQIRTTTHNNIGDYLDIEL